MTQDFYQVLISLIAGIITIVILTAKLRVHPFFALLIASFVVGLGVQLSVPDVINAVKDGFGNIMRSLGLIIVLGTALYQRAKDEIAQAFYQLLCRVW